MPSRGSYQLANVVEGRAAERDQSYRSCVSSLLIFCFFCVVLILVNLPWKSYRYYNSEEKDEYINTIQHHIKHETERTTSSMEPIKLLPTTTFVDENNSIEIEIEKHETTESFEVFTGNSSVENETNSNIIDSSKSNIEAVTIDLSQTEIYNEIVTEKLDTSSVININITEDGTSISAEKFQETDTTEATTLVFIDDQEILNEIENSTEANITELIIKEIKKYQEIDTIDKYTVETSTSTFIDYRETPNEVEESIEADITKLAMKEENVTIESITMNQQDVFTYPTILTATSSSPIDKSICLEGECKNLASKILFYMNHTIDPCEDFYEYACGGFEANPQTVEWDLENVAYQRILRQMQKENEENISSLFADYYNSCVQYKNINQTERIKLGTEKSHV